MSRPQAAAALLAALFCIGFLTYLPGAEGPYLLDDFHALVNNPALDTELLERHGPAIATYSFGQGISARPLSMLSFGVNYWLAGNDGTYAIKLTNILLHLLTALLIYLFTRRLYPHLKRTWKGNESAATEAPLIAAVATALWLLHPLHVSTVLYAVQRMAILSALFTMAGLLLYLEGREQLIEGKRFGALWILAALGLAGGLATLSKENGALLPFYVLAVEVAALRFSFHPAIPRRIKLAVTAAPVLLGAVLLLLIVRHLWLPETYAARPFTAWERLLAESNILFFYLKQLFLPSIDEMGLFWGEWESVRNLALPLAPSVVLAAWGAILALALWATVRKRALPAALAALWFISAHLMESTVISLEPIFEHRNYLAAFGPALLVAWLITPRPGDPLPLLGVRAATMLLLPALLVAGLNVRVGQWSSTDGFYQHELDHHADSIRLWRGYGQYLEREGRIDEAKVLYHRATNAIAKEAGFPLAEWLLHLRQREAVPERITEQARIRLATQPVSRAASWNLLRLVRDNAGRPDTRLEAALIGAAENPHWHTEGWNSFGLFLLAEFYAATGRRREAEEWLAGISKERAEGWQRVIGEYTRMAETAPPAL